MDYKVYFLILKIKNEALELTVIWKIISQKVLNWVSLIVCPVSRQEQRGRKEYVVCM